MKQISIKLAALAASLMPATSLLAHSELNGQSGLLVAAHDFLHAIQTNFWLPALLLALVCAGFLIPWKNRRES